MGTKVFTYNFRTQTGQHALAARIASIKTTALQELIKMLFGSTVNIMQKFAAPPKCNAAIYIVDNAPQMQLQQVIAEWLPRWENDVRQSASRPGRDVHVYKHDPNKDNRQFTPSTDESDDTTPQIDDVPQQAMKNDSVQAIVAEQTKPQTATEQRIIKDSQPMKMDEGRVREIAREEDAKVAKFIETTIASAVKEITKPTVVHIAYEQKDGTDAVRDMGIQHKQFPVLLNLCNTRDHNGYVFPVWLPGPAGSGKTTAAMNVAISLGIEFYHNGAVSDEFQLLGFRDAGGTFHQTPFYKAYKNGGVYLFDEVDASAANALVALNAALENAHCTFGNGETVHRHKQCIIIAAANTFGMGATHEYVGRNKIDAATVDRFIMLGWDYDDALEDAIAQHPEWVAKVRRIRSAVARLGIKHVVSPRASIRGAALLRSGHFTEEQVLKLCVYKGMTQDQIRSVS